jgi:hypothetical protein
MFPLATAESTPRDAPRHYAREKPVPPAEESVGHGAGPPLRWPEVSSINIRDYRWFLDRFGN